MPVYATHWSIWRHQPSGDAYAIYDHDGSGAINEIVGPLAHGEHAAARRGECAGNGSPEDLTWATTQTWRPCQCKDCTASMWGWAATASPPGPETA